MDNREQLLVSGGVEAVFDKNDARICAVVLFTWDMEGSVGNLEETMRKT